MEIEYTNVTKGKGLILTGAMMMFFSFLLLFILGAILIIPLVFGYMVYKIGKIKYWWYNE
jgi:uncharacterized membrane protein YccF (DUF307 family)